MSHRVTISQLKVKPNPESKVPEYKDTLAPMSSTSNSISSSSSSSTVKSGPSSTSSSLPTRVNANAVRSRKMKREVKTSTAEDTQILPPGKKNDDDNKGLNLDLNYLKMLPAEIWEIVFKEIKNPLDFQALINSSASWRKLLEKERTTFLFALVFPILLKKKLIDYKNGDAESEVDVAEQQDEASKRSKVTKDFKDYRCVCKTWDMGIQDYVQRYYRNSFLSSMKMCGEMRRISEEFEKDDPRIVDNYNYTREIEYRLQARHYVLDTVEINKFLDKFNLGYQEFNRNPILTGCVVISDFYFYVAMGPPRPFLNDGLIQTTESLLRSFGVHIHFLTLELGHICSWNVIAFQRNVYNCLKHVPNLKGLILKYKADDRRRSSEPLHEPEPEVMLHYGRNSDDVPKLANLQFLEVYNVPGVIFSNIVANATSLRKVSIQLTSESRTSYGDYFKSDPRFGEGPQMPLSMLNMNIRSIDDLVNLESSLERGISLKFETLCIRFYQCMEVTYQLRRYQRLFEFGYKAGWYNGLNDFSDYETEDFYYVPEKDHVYCSESDEGPPWSHLFRVVELLGAESLLKLSIRLPAAVKNGASKLILAECHNLRLNLSKLKSIVIQSPYWTSIDFLLGMKDTLEEATLIFPNFMPKMPYKDRLKEQIRFNGYFHVMLRSNIWSEMPKLKKLSVRVAHAKLKLKEYNYERPS